MSIPPGDVPAGASRPAIAELRDLPYRHRRSSSTGGLASRLLNLLWTAGRQLARPANWRRAWRGLRRAPFSALPRLAVAGRRRVMVLWSAEARIRHLARGERWNRASRSVALFAHYAPNGVVSGMVRQLLDEYTRLGCNVIVVTASTAPGSPGWEALSQRSAFVLHRRNLGHDFGGWADAMPLLLQHFPNTDEVLLLNDSVLGPVRPLEPVLAALRGSGAGFFGLTDSHQIKPHLQSYFLVARGAAAIADLAGFLRAMPITLTKRGTIKRGEVALTGWMRRRGHLVGALFPYEAVEATLVSNAADRAALLAGMRPGVLRRWLAWRGEPTELQLRRWLMPRRLNPTHHMASVLVRRLGFPFIKTDLVTRNPTRLPEALAWRDWLGEDSVCDLATIEAHLGEVVRPHCRTAPVLPLAPVDSSAVRRLPATERSLALPLGYRPGPAPGWRIGVLLHLFHAELADEMLAWLEHLPGPADLHITTDTAAKRASLERAFAGWRKGEVAIRLVPNRGRDVAARLVGQRDLFGRYPLLLCLHGKLASRQAPTAQWRDYLLRHLLGGVQEVAGIIEAFASAPTLGVVAPQHLEWLRPRTGWGVNFTTAAGLAARMGLDLPPAQPLDFPSGSMFWARGAALQPLLDLRLRFDDFPEEAGQTDGTPAHALERLIFLACEAAGYRWAKVAIPALHQARANIVRAGSPSVLERFLAHPAEPLLDPPPAAPFGIFPALGLSLAFPTVAATPDISVIIPCHGAVAVTLRCLAALAAAPPRASLEVIVAEDASGDPEVARLAEIPGLTLLRNAQNLGFLRNCNAAASGARGRFLLFLNNDTEVRPGALDAMLALAEARPDAGLVGARLVFPDGRLQEAGGIIWNDASGWNVGRGEDPWQPAYDYVREVDYCSGAAILIRSALFAEMNGFDQAFAPAYYEDTDLAFRLRERGLKVMYQPRAVVVHHEGVSHGTDIASGIKAWQVRNQAVMLKRWQAVLANAHAAPGSSVFRARDRAQGRQVVLVADHKVPEPDRDAGSRCCMDMLRTLLEAGKVVKFLPDNGALAGHYGEALQEMGIEVLHGPPEQALGWINRHGAEIDQALLQRPEVAQRLLPALRGAGVRRIVYFGHDLHSARMSQEASHRADVALRDRARAMEALERRLCREADVAMFPSETEVTAMARLEAAATLRRLPLYRVAEVARRAQPPTGAEMVFVAGFAHPPNEDAAMWLVEAVLPLIRRRCPGVRLGLVGSHPNAKVRALAAAAAVTVTGAVSEEVLARHYAAARVAIVPLRFGAGVKGKVIEAMASGLPLVTTPVGAQGLPGLTAVLPVAETPAAMAAAVVELLTDDARWCRQSAAQAEYVAREFAPVRMREALLGALDGAAG